MPDTNMDIWRKRAGFAALTLLIIFAQLLPVETAAPHRWAGFDLLMVFAMAWSVRRPEYVPGPLLAVLFLLADFLLQRPPGLWALLMLLACESLKSRHLSLRDAGFPTEYLTAGAMIVSVYVANRVILSLLFVDLPPLGLYLLQMVVTLAAYPVAVFLTHVILRVRKVSAGDVGAGGLGQ
jgi:rod shape-determining protein MreD